MDDFVFKVFLILGTVSLVAHFIYLRKRHQKDYREYLEPLLADHNLSFISSKFPGWFKVGPFPKVEVKIGVAQSQFPLVGSGEYVQYRMVTITTETGERHTIWAKLNFELFMLTGVQWQTENHPIPKELEALLADVKKEA